MVGGFYKDLFGTISLSSRGGIGIRTGLKILGPYGIEGSSPSGSMPDMGKILQKCVIGILVSDY